MLRILSWNIRQGGGSRIRAITRRIVSADAQIVILSEFRNNAKGTLLRNKLLESGYRHQFVSQAQANENSVLICSHFAGNSRVFNSAAWDYAQNIIVVDYSAFSVYGMYLPHKKKHKLFQLLSSEVSEHTPSILAGDFNTGKNFIDQKGDSFWYTDELKALEDKSMIDAFRHLYPKAKEYSWYSHQGNGYRYDHTYIHEDLLPFMDNCFYLHEWREEGNSDHSPMILDLKF